MACPFSIKKERKNNMKTFNLAGNTLVAKEIDFNLLADFDDYGVSIDDASSKPLVFMRAYVACCINSTLAEAGKMINDHVIAGGSLEDIMSAINDELETSGFFRAISSQQETVPTEDTTSKKKASK